jgi:ATPase components of various ABC-type transport systems, contain duplicated ATPase
MPDLRFENVSIVYRARGSSTRGDVTAVRDITLDLPQGGTLGIAGESGSGKTTLAMSVLRLLPRSARLSGHVLVGDQDVSDLSFGRLRALRWSEASIVFQGAMHSLNPVREIGRQIVEALELHVQDGWRTPTERDARVVELLRGVDLPEEVARAYPHELSGGQKQRVMIAMALACEPDLIIADEPTTALDVIVQKQILDALHDLVTARGISLLIISHDLSVLATACERIAVMRDGALVEVGDAVQVCTAPREEYTARLAAAFPVIGDPQSRMNPISRRSYECEPAASADELRQREILLEARKLSVTFQARGRRVVAVRSVDIEVRQGEILALVGQSGSGKTTLARTLLGLQQPDQVGNVFFRGRELRYTRRALGRFRREVQMVSQDPTAALNPKLSVYEQVAEGLRIQKFQGDERERVAQALADAEMSPPEEFFSALPRELSGGQRQRVVIAAALAVAPSVLVADEPVASLDASVRGEILALLLDLRRRLGLSALVITHDLGLAWNVADTVAVMYHGEIVEHGPTESVLGNPQHPYTRTLLAAAPSIAQVGR